MSIVASRMNRIKMSPTAAARVIIAELRQNGTDIVDLTIGEPDFDTPEHIRAAGEVAIRDGDTHYPLSQGTPALRKAIRFRILDEIGMDYPVERIIVSTGAKQVIYNGLVASLDDGDEVIIPAPYWVSYPDMVTLAGGAPVVAPADVSNGYKIDAAALSSVITPATKWLMLNSPSNPSGAVYDEAELADLASVLRKHPHVHVMTDDIYARLTFSQPAAPHLLQVAPDLVDRVLIVNGVSKAYAMTGWRIGYGAGPSELVKAMAVVQSQSTSGASSIGQAAAVAALSGPQACVGQFAARFRQRRDIAIDILSQAQGLKLVAPEGAFYVFPDCSDLIGRKTPAGDFIDSDTALVHHILRQTGVAVIDGSSYGVPGTFRLSYATGDDIVERGCLAIRDVCNAIVAATAPQPMEMH
ncbi:pyridoxal phosphate-dependent aminotransferase [Aureimonas altamirensis]|uniref:pyridoxal phosphate-dependent aminotransferase n=1 Tax=Aureimonas altamirensis TaxID=370622 RepID=UPI0020370345|nr:pyridoxal phosphate-dependent aminotransferase [Aureimonas altamirensis]MCM2502475.1 pyridoxal phosphate-dependent aminotransferase [Aureimonas altamirensis]